MQPPSFLPQGLVLGSIIRASLMGCFSRGGWGGGGTSQVLIVERSTSMALCCVCWGPPGVWRCRAKFRTAMRRSPPILV